MPLQDEIERKFLLKAMPKELPDNLSTIIIVQDYLLIGDKSARVRIELIDSKPRYTYNEKQFVEAGHHKEFEEEITIERYTELLARYTDPDNRTLVKQRIVFHWYGQKFELDQFLVPNGVHVLEIELPSLDTPIKLPDFLDIEREVTTERHWTNKAMARKNWKISGMEPPVQTGCFVCQLRDGYLCTAPETKPIIDWMIRQIGSFPYSASDCPAWKSNL